MNESEGYVVYLFPAALEALGEAIKPYLREGPGGEHILCHEIDTAGSLIEMTIQAATNEGNSVALELMVPQQMVRMIVSARSDAAFGFSPRVAPALMTLPPMPRSAPKTDAPAQAAPPPAEAPAAKTEAPAATSQANLPPEG
ncbi:hypothetical protein LYSHEL_03130 [Lysobacter helvus]|uniref:Uncharacterized protein n=2 Tax=Lysobacteraceae TaxID=32033 RepID=A0ABN6FQR7_9GAMM|nr:MULTISPECIES: hypothetical protein [Lysobacter]BCT91289.1 hypothetical protein LYSCAS_03130 [Lysobacter caseinilyticus]BCT94442.1 hypothetical protein LYSHEL_03130 [Lysobacter helvus]